MSDYDEVKDFLNLQIVKEKQLAIKKDKPYVFPKKYIPYDTFLAIVTSAMFVIKVKTDWNVCSCHFYIQAAKWNENNTPIYGLSTETLELFTSSTIDDYKDLFENLEESNELVSYCVLLPSKSFPTVNGGFLEILWIEAIQNNTANTMFATSHVHKGIYNREIATRKRRIVSGGIDTNGILWCASTIYPKQDDDNSTNANIGTIIMDTNDTKTVLNIREITLQIVMAIEYLPEAIDIPVNTVSQKGFGATAKTVSSWHIRNLHIEQKKYINSESSSAQHGDSNRSVRPHWRKYHWRRFATGKGRINREWRLVKTVLVNSQHNAE